jgi:hypothetical protein
MYYMHLMVRAGKPGALLLLACLAIPAYAQPQRSFWKASVMALAAAGVADAHSSYQRREANPILRDADGRFTARGIGIKAAITGGALGIQYLLCRKNRAAERPAAWINFGMAGFVSGMAARNYQNGSTRRPAYLAPRQPD